MLNLIKISHNYFQGGNTVDVIKDLDVLPIPARDLFPNERYMPLPNQYKKLPATNMVVIRGCPYVCSFCDQARTGARRRSPEKVIFDNDNSPHNISTSVDISGEAFTLTTLGMPSNVLCVNKPITIIATITDIYDNVLNLSTSQNNYTLNTQGPIISPFAQIQAQEDDTIEVIFDLSANPNYDLSYNILNYHGNSNPTWEIGTYTNMSNSLHTGINTAIDNSSNFTGSFTFDPSVNFVGLSTYAIEITDNFVGTRPGLTNPAKNFYQFSIFVTPVNNPTSIAPNITYTLHDFEPYQMFFASDVSNSNTIQIVDVDDNNFDVSFNSENNISLIDPSILSDVSNSLGTWYKPGLGAAGTYPFSNNFNPGNYVTDTVNVTITDGVSSLHYDTSNNNLTDASLNQLNNEYTARTITSQINFNILPNIHFSQIDISSNKSSVTCNNSYLSYNKIDNVNTYARIDVSYNDTPIDIFYDYRDESPITITLETNLTDKLYVSGALYRDITSKSTLHTSLPTDDDKLFDIDVSGNSSLYTSVRTNTSVTPYTKTIVVSIPYSDLSSNLTSNSTYQIWLQTYHKDNPNIKGRYIPTPLFRFYTYHLLQDQSQTPTPQIDEIFIDTTTYTFYYDFSLNLTQAPFYNQVEYGGLQLHPDDTNVVNLIPDNGNGSSTTSIDNNFSLPLTGLFLPKHTYDITLNFNWPTSANTRTTWEGMGRTHSTDNLSIDFRAVLYHHLPKITAVSIQNNLGETHDGSNNTLFYNHDDTSNDSGKIHFKLTTNFTIDVSGQIIITRNSSNHDTSLEHFVDIVTHDTHSTQPNVISFVPTEGGSYNARYYSHSQLSEPQSDPSFNMLLGNFTFHKITYPTSQFVSLLHPVTFRVLLNDEIEQHAYYSVIEEVTWYNQETNQLIHTVNTPPFVNTEIIPTDVHHFYGKIKFRDTSHNIIFGTANITIDESDDYSSISNSILSITTNHEWTETAVSNVRELVQQSNRFMLISRKNVVRQRDYQDASLITLPDKSLLYTPLVITSIVQPSSVDISENSLRGVIYTATSNKPGTLWISNNPEIATINNRGEMRLANPPTYKETYIISIEARYGGKYTVDEIVELHVNTITPVIAEPTPVPIIEGQSLDRVVYTASANKILNWSLGNLLDNSNFTINSDGEVRLLSHSKSIGDSYKLTIIGTDLFGDSDNYTITIPVQGYVGITSSSGNSIAENFDITNTVYNATADKDVAWSLLSTQDGDQFNIQPDTTDLKKAYVYLNTSPNFETKSSYIFTVQANITETGESVNKVVTLTITDVDEITSVSLTEITNILYNNFDISNKLFTASASPLQVEDDPLPYTWSLTGSHGQYFVITQRPSEKNRADVLFDPNHIIDYDTLSSYSITVVAERGGEIETSQVTLNVAEPLIITSGNTAVVGASAANDTYIYDASANNSAIT